MGPFWRWWGGQPRAARGERSRRGRWFRPAVEGLEERAVPAFFPTLSVGVGDSPGSVAVGDFNRDGKQDLIVVAAFEVNLLLGKGDGTFQPVRNFALGNPDALVLADFNGDGKKDLAATDTGAVTLLLQS